MKTFEREDRYVVLKIKDLETIPTGLMLRLHSILADLNEHLPERKYVCVESDWPEYEKVWGMIEERMSKEASDGDKD